MGDFRQLKVWQISKDLAIKIYRITDDSTAFAKDFRFRDQIRSAAISVPSNIAEGDELDSNKQSNRHFYISRGSCAEVITQLIVAMEVEYLDGILAHSLITDYEHLSAMLSKLIKARSTRNP